MKSLTAINKLNTDTKKNKKKTGIWKTFSKSNLTQHSNSKKGILILCIKES